MNDTIEEETDFPLRINDIRTVAMDDEVLTTPNPEPEQVLIKQEPRRTSEEPMRIPKEEPNEIPFGDSHFLSSDEDFVREDNSHLLDRYFNSTVGISIDKEIELRNLLSNWKQEELFQHLIDQEITVDTLKLMKRDHIKSLMEEFKVGTWVLFEHNMEQWRESIGFPLDMPQMSSYFKSSSRRRSGGISPYERGPTVNGSCTTLHLNSILQYNLTGEMLVEYYNKFQKFDEVQRSALISLVVQYFQNNGIKMTLADSYKLEKEITETFQSEKLEYYRTGKRGRLYNKFCNTSLLIKGLSNGASSVPDHPVVTKKDLSVSRNADISDPETDAEDCLRALKFANLTSQQFDRTWKACSQFRMKFIKENSTSDIFEKWPFYKNLSGYRLIDMDFKTFFHKDTELLDKWDEFYNKMLNYLSKDGIIKEKNVKSIITDLQKNKDCISRNGRDAGLIWAIHGHLVPTNKSVVKDKSGKKTVIKHTIRDSQESVIFYGSNLQTINEKIDNLKKIKPVLQPSIYCIGEDIFSIRDISVYFDEIRYPFNSIVKALDICFKIMFVFNLEFPVESHNFYSFIEHYFFNTKSGGCNTKVHILSEKLCTL